jgi:hypothetical protein
MKAISKGTSGSVFANIAFVAIETVNFLGKVDTGELTVEGIDTMQQTTMAYIAGLTTSVKGIAIGLPTYLETSC